MNLDRLKGSLRKHEGISLTPYHCTAGYLTVGIGKNLDNGLSIQQVYAILDLDIQECIAELDRAFHGWRNHPEVQQTVLLEMMFNLGAPRLATFKKMWAALARQDYPAAATEMLDSRWAMQVGQRAVTLANQMRSGRYQ